MRRSLALDWSANRDRHDAAGEQSMNPEPPMIRALVLARTSLVIFRPKNAAAAPPRPCRLFISKSSHRPANTGSRRIDEFAVCALTDEEDPERAAQQSESGRFGNRGGVMICRIGEARSA
jgi:hypothetical protein